MRKLITTIITILISTQIFAQNYTDTVSAKQYCELADKYQNKWVFDSALIYYQKASDIFNKIVKKNSNDTLIWRKKIKCLYNISWTLADLIKYEAAEKKLDTALFYSLKYFGEKHKQTANVYYGLGNIFNKKSQYDKSLKYLFKSLKIRYEITGNKSNKIANTYELIGNAYGGKSNYDKALEFYLKSLEIRGELLGEKHINVSHSYQNIADIYFTKSEYNMALKYYFKSLKIRQELLGNSGNYIAYSYDNIGSVYDAKSEYNKALEYYLKSLEIKKNILGDNELDVATSYSNIGIVFAEKSEYNKALEYFLKSLEIETSMLGEYNIHVAPSYTNIGIVYSQKSEYDKALKYLYKGLEIEKKLLGDSNIGVAYSYISIGDVYDKKLEYDKALKYLYKGLEIEKKLLGEKNIIVAISYDHIGGVFWNKIEYNKAIEYYYKSFFIKKQLLGEKGSSIANSYNNIGLYHMVVAGYDTALKKLQFAIYANLRGNVNTSDIYKVPIIKEYYEYSNLLYSLHSKAQIFADANIILKNLNKKNKIVLALRHYQVCDTLITRVRKEMTTKSDKLALGETANKIYHEAVNLCVNIAEKTEDLKQQQSMYEQAFYFSEKNKSSVLLESLAGAEALKFAGIPDTLLKLEHKYSIDIANYINLKNNAENDSLENMWNNRLFKIQRSYDSLIVVFEKQYPKYYNLKYNNSPANIKQVSKLLNKKTAILSYLVGDSTITIFAIKKKRVFGKQNFIVKQVPKPEKFNFKIFDLREAISNTSILSMEMKNKTHESVDDYVKNANEFYNILFPKEIIDFLGKKTKNLIIIPDGLLATLPFEILHIQKYTASWTGWENKDYFSEMPYLVNKYNISYSYSATLFKENRSKQKTNNVELTSLNDWIAFAPVFDNEDIVGTTTRTRKLLTFKSESDSIKTQTYLRDVTYITPLPDSKKEVKAIFGLYEKQGKKAVIKTHKQASEKFIKSKEVQNYKILHFATHGFVNEEKPELSGILLAQDTTSTLSEIDKLLGLKPQNEGVLYQSEIYNLKFNADLVVLSACETGLGKITKGEGVIGLTRALLYAGSKNIIVSLWQVSDASTKELMINFYKKLLKEKKQDKFAEHLSNAKRKMITDKKYAHPFFWSPFILIGE